MPQNAPYFSAIDIAIGETNRDLRLGLKAMLSSNGMHGIHDCQTCEKLSEVVANRPIDLILCDCGLIGGDFCELVRDIRYGKLGDNPFIFIVGTMEIPSQDQVRRAINSGLDDLLVKPVSLDAITTRLVNFAMKRKPFVVTHNYIGPDRRSKKREEEVLSTDLIEVPNPLAAKKAGPAELLALPRQIKLSVAVIEHYKMLRHATQIGYMSEKLVEVWREEDEKTHIQDALKHIYKYAADLYHHIPGTRFCHLKGETLSLCSNIADSLISSSHLTKEAILDINEIAHGLSEKFNSVGVEANTRSHLETI